MMLSFHIFSFLVVLAFAVGGKPPQLPAEEKKENAYDSIVEANKKIIERTQRAFSAGGVELIEGDIVLTPKLKSKIAEMRVRSSTGMSGFDAISNGAWPNCIVPYRYASGFAYGNAVQQAISEFKAKTGIEFKPYTAKLAQIAGGYVEFMHGGGCYSMIGRQGRKQQISLGTGCGTKGVAIHEMMHALGFYHEQSRRDRDNYITIYWNNINRAMWYNFEMYRMGEASTLGEGYDKQSIMHYGNYAFSINGRKTISSKSNPSEKLGQRQGLSATDVRQLKKYYKCGGKPVVTSAPPTNCKNLFDFCADIPKKWCTNNWLKVNCKKSCNLCTKSSCIDIDKSGNCGAWANRQRYCNHQKYKRYMKKNCQKSCRLC